jgi:hypothetical protein
VYFLIFLILISCSNKNIPYNILIKNDLNIHVYNVLNKYKEEIENINSNGILKLISFDFFLKNENSVKFSNYKILRKRLKKIFSLIKENYLDFHLQYVEIESKKINVYCYFFQRTLIEYPYKKKWFLKESLNKMIFIRGKSGDLKILSGI